MIVGLLWLGQRRLIYLPFGDVPPAAAVIPRAREVQFDTADGLTLGGWFVPPLREPARATVLVFNGNAGNRSMRAPLAVRLAVAGYAVLLFDYRGYGGNPGRPTEAGLIADARAARAWLMAVQEVPAERLVYFGESLGAGVAVALAVEARPAALILRSPFTSLVDVGRMHYPILPVGRLLADRFPSIEQIRRIDCPLLIIAGDRDTIVPLALSERLFETALQADKHLLTIAGAGHNDLELLAGDEMLRELDLFLSRYLTHP